jgi:hypothetical protein
MPSVQYFLIVIDPHNLSMTKQHSSLDNLLSYYTGIITQVHWWRAVFQKVLTKSRVAGMGRGEILAAEYTHRTSSPMMHNHKSQYSTRRTFGRVVDTPASCL